MKGAPIIAPQVKPKAKSRLNRKNQHTGGPPHDRNQVGSQRRQQQPENEQVSGGGVGQADSFVGDAQQRWDDDNEFTAVDAGIDGATLLRNGGEDEEGGDKGSLARSILMGGNVQSFVDFFYLTHRPDPKAQQGQGEEGGKNEEVQGIDVGRREQEFIKENLITAELSRRSGDTPSVYSAYTALASYYSSPSISDPKTSVYFQEKCLEISKLTGDWSGEMRANHELGKVFSMMGDLDGAIRFHERHMTLAREKGMMEEKVLASSELEKVYGRSAEEMGDRGEFDKSVEFYSKQLEAARANRDRRAEGSACFRLGGTYVIVGQPEKAVQFLDEYERISIELDDLTGHGKASASLAKAYQSLGDADKAVAYLQNYLDISSKTENLQSQGEACSALGVIYNSRGDFAKSVEMFEKNFEIARSIVSSGQGTTSLVDRSRVYLGIAKGNMIRRKIMTNIGDVNEIIEWKRLFN